MIAPPINPTIPQNGVDLKMLEMRQFIVPILLIPCHLQLRLVSVFFLLHLIGNIRRLHLLLVVIVVEMIAPPINPTIPQNGVDSHSVIFFLLSLSYVTQNIDAGFRRAYKWHGKN